MVVTIMVCIAVITPRRIALKNPDPEISPDEIRAIREYLGLSQAEAGKVIGGGPRAFTKYEAGAVKPSAAVVNALRHMQADPAAVATLQGNKSLPLRVGATSPFEVAGAHIAALTERTFPDLLRRLLNAEAEANNLPADGIQVASNIHAADGGVDGRIIWSDGPARTPFLRGRHNQFQLKAGKISPSQAGKEVTKKGAVKDMVRSALEDGGHYIMLCARSYTPAQIDVRRARIREALHDVGMTIHDDQVDFRDADQIALWANRHPSVAVWVKEQTEPGTIGPFRSWSSWARDDRPPWEEDERLPVFGGRLRDLLAEPRQIVRVVGPPGVGKTRLVFEALGHTEEEAGLCLSDLVMYAVQSVDGAEVINQVVQQLSDKRARAVVVVDDCDPDAHQILAGMVLRQGSRLSLVTIDNEIPAGKSAENTLEVEKAPSRVTEGIIDHFSPGLPYEDQSRLARFSEGFPEIAVRVGKAWSESRPIPHAADDGLVDAFVLGRSPRNRDLLLNSAELIAVFPFVDVDSPNVGQLSEVAELGGNLSPDNLYAAVTQLIDRRVARKRGRYITIQPRPIAMKLAERRWKKWPPDMWERLLSGGINPSLRVLAAQQLALLNTTNISQDVAGYVCRSGGPFDGLEAIFTPGHAEVLSELAAIDSEAVVNRIECALHEVEDLSKVSIDVRGHLVRALEKIAFHACTFEEGARLLLRLAAAEKDMLSRLPDSGDFWRRSLDSNAADKFKKLFPMFLGGTEADGDARLSFLDGAADSGDPAQREVVAEGLIAGCKTHHFERFLGPEAQGSAPALPSWRPATNREAFEYIKGCFRRLAQLASGDDRDGVTARAGLADVLDHLLLEGFISIDEVEAVVHQVTAATVDYWPAALGKLRAVLTYHGQKIGPEATERVRKLVHELQPKSLESRIGFLATGMSWNHRDGSGLDISQQYQREVEAMRKLASEALEQPATLMASLPQLSRDRTRMALEFGAAIAELADSPTEWLEPLINAIQEAPEDERNYDLLSGFIMGLAEGHPSDVDVFKQRAVRSGELAPAFLRVCLRFGITRTDIQMATAALNDGLLPPHHFLWWSFGGKLAEVSAPEVAPLFDTMLYHKAEGFTVAVQLMGMYAHGAPEKLEGLLPQVLKLAENATRWEPTRDWNECQYDFELIMGWILGKGRQNPDARAAALVLARGVANVEEFDSDLLIMPLFPKLLSGFPEIAWPLIGQAIVSDPRRAWRLRFILGDQNSFGRTTDPAILSLPEDTLFAWCHANPDRAPAFSAETIPVLTAEGVGAPERSLHPLMARLLDEFGERSDVLQAVGRNIGSFSWWGSMVSYYAPYKGPLSKLVQHQKPQVNGWARSMLRQLDAMVEAARNEDEEREAWAEI